MTEFYLVLKEILWNTYLSHSCAGIHTGRTDVCFCRHIDTHPPHNKRNFSPWDYDSTDNLQHDNCIRFHAQSEKHEDT